MRKRVIHARLHIWNQFPTSSRVGVGVSGKIANRVRGHWGTTIPSPIRSQSGHHAPDQTPMTHLRLNLLIIHWPFE